MANQTKNLNSGKRPAKSLRPKTNKNGSAKVKPVDANNEISEAQALEELTRLAWSINTRLERIHDGLQDVIRDMRAMRGSDSP
ncbi:MAG: hypothetical protein JO316_11560 [Abitibacteriaceae bacterium]|nr:hypothetical protein [Abditibacteriaceae bacterium]